MMEFNFQSGSIVYAWDSVDVEGDEISQTRDSSGRVLYQARTVTDLESDTAYVAKIKVSNFHNISTCSYNNPISTKVW